ncbi:MAG TPA: SPOR domain-containing protein [Burkholderiales bacterium]|nr:SPOR domain-containing protein [Burkholderiales bacterium]
MARAISDEELQLKKRARRRLVGAVVLVTAVAVILPMVLDSDPRPVNQNVDIQIPSPDSGEFKPKAGAPATTAPESSTPKVTPKSAPAPDAPSSSAANSPPAAAKPTAAAPAAAGSEPTPAPFVKASPKSEPAPVKADAQDPARIDTASAKNQTKGNSKDGVSAPAGAYVVQVAALADAARVKQLQKQMTGVGLKTYTEVVATQSGEVTRVRAGPYATREAAEKARAQLQKAGLEGKVLPK